MNTSARLCKFCEKEINLLIGRRDRQFCDEECKNRFHNKIAYEEEREAKRINKILKKNRNILKKMSLRKDNEEISRERLLKEGFDFNYHTHHKISVHQKNEYTFCYDYGYRLSMSVKLTDLYKIVKAFNSKSDE